MRTLNDIPWKEETTEDTWTPMAGLCRGAACTITAGLLLASAIGAISYYAPMIMNMWLLTAALGFLITCLLFSIMHRVSGLTGGWSNAIVVCVVLVVFLGKQLGLGLSSDLQGHFDWSVLSPYVFFFGNYPAWVCTIGAVMICKDGDSVVHDVADMLMTNPLTGRR